MGSSVDKRLAFRGVLAALCGLAGAVVGFSINHDFGGLIGLLVGIWAGYAVEIMIGRILIGLASLLILGVRVAIFLARFDVALPVEAPADAAGSGEHPPPIFSAEFSEAQENVLPFEDTETTSRTLDSHDRRSPVGTPEAARVHDRPTLQGRQPSTNLYDKAQTNRKATVSDETCAIAALENLVEAFDLSDRSLDNPSFELFMLWGRTKYDLGACSDGFRAAYEGFRQRWMDLHDINNLYAGGLYDQRPSDVEIAFYRATDLSELRAAARKDFAGRRGDELLDSLRPAMEATRALLSISSNDAYTPEANACIYRTLVHVMDSLDKKYLPQRAMTESARLAYLESTARRLESFDTSECPPAFTEEFLVFKANFRAYYETSRRAVSPLFRVSRNELDRAQQRALDLAPLTDAARRSYNHSFGNLLWKLNQRFGS